MTEMELPCEPSSHFLIMQSTTMIAPLSEPQTHKPMHTVDFPANNAAADNDVSSNEDTDKKLFDRNASMALSVTTESTLPMSVSDHSINSNSDQGSPDSLKTAPQTPLEQQEPPLSPRTAQLTEDSTTPQSISSSITQSPPPQPVSKAQSIRDKRRMMEAWHDEQKSKASMRSVVSTTSVQEPKASSFSAFSPNNSRKKKLLLGKSASSRRHLGGNKQRKGSKEEMARYSRMVDRITNAEKQAKNRIRLLSRQQDQREARDRMLCLRERAELKLRLSQMEKARDFYQSLIASNTTEAIPMEVLKTINGLPNYQPKQHATLKEELEAYVKSVQKEDPEEAGYMFQEIRDWKDSIDMALEVGSIAPDFCLPYNKKMIDSKFLRQQWRIILVFYHDYNSTMCKMNLMALETLKKTYENEGAQLVAIGFEADTMDTADETEVTFPLLADDVGILATKFGIIRGEELPILSTFIIDHDGTILWRYVNTDYTKRPEPMDILEALPEKNFKSKSHPPRTNGTTGKRKMFFRKSSQKKR